MSQAQDQVLLYHQQTKHRLNAYARGPGMLDWANQPDPFRRYIGSPQIMLNRSEPEPAAGGRISPPAPLNMQSISRFFLCSLALSAWKSAGGSTWPLRVNPSSGNLHPTESYLIAGSIEGLAGSPGIFHYAPDEHSLERRSGISVGSWVDLRLPERAFLIAVSSIHWRESWKYGERAYRYSMIDTGHAIAALGISASCLGWQAALLEGFGTADLCSLLGFSGEDGVEAERPDCLMAVFADGEMHDPALPPDKLAGLNPAAFQGTPNILSVEHADWPVIEDVAKAASKPTTEKAHERAPFRAELPLPDLCRVLRKRRSAQAMDRQTAMPIGPFFDTLSLTLPNKAPFNLFPWRSRVHLVLFVHRVEGLESGLYMLVRDMSRMEGLSAAMRQGFEWKHVEMRHAAMGHSKRMDTAMNDASAAFAAPQDFGLYLLQRGDARYAARQSSCRQDIASDGCFAAAMLSEFDSPLQEFGAWFYPRLFWECGMIGQSLYLGAEIAGFRGCGIGCYFDDAVHEMLGLKDRTFQDLYHFTVGKAIDDPRIAALPAYE